MLCAAFTDTTRTLHLLQRGASLFFCSVPVENLFQMPTVTHAKTWYSVNFGAPCCQPDG